MSAAGGKLVKPMMTLVEEQHHREIKPLLHQDTEEVGCCDVIVNAVQVGGGCCCFYHKMGLPSEYLVARTWKVYFSFLNKKLYVIVLMIYLSLLPDCM